VSAPPYTSYPYAILWDGEYIWVTLGTSNVVVKMASTGAIVGTYPTGFAPNGIDFDGTSIWVTDQVCACAPGFTTGCTSCPPGTVTRLRPSDGATLGTHYVGARPQWVHFDGQYLWVTNGSDNTVSRCLPW
jgi:DNA-binding beta-propeller fold protein YncE